MTASPPRPNVAEAPESNVIRREDLAVHGWYRFVLSYPPHLVQKYARLFGLGGRDLLCDPFCGTGTTLVEAKKLGIPSVGIDAHPFAALASRVKTTWNLVPGELRSAGRRIVSLAERRTREAGLSVESFSSLLMEESPAGEWRSYKLGPEEQKVMPAGFMSERPLARLLILRECIEELAGGAERREFLEFFQIAMAHVVANGAGNFAFGPEIYRTREKFDYDVTGHFATRVAVMADDIDSIRGFEAPASVIHGDSRALDGLPSGVSAVITSPPYPNEKDYTRTTRVESLILGFTADRSLLRSMKELLLRSNTRNVFVSDTDGDEILDIESIRAVCDSIEQRRVELEKTSGFERLYHKVVAHYFGGMRRHLRALRPKLKQRARLAYVVGDQLSFLMVPVATGRLLGEVAEAEGYKVAGLDLWRERVGTKVRNCEKGSRTVRVREEVLLLEKA